MGTGSFRLAMPSVTGLFLHRDRHHGAGPCRALPAPPLGCVRTVLRQPGTRGVNRHKPVLTGRTQMKVELGDMAWRPSADVSARR